MTCRFKQSCCLFVRYVILFINIAFQYIFKPHAAILANWKNKTAIVNILANADYKKPFPVLRNIKMLGIQHLHIVVISHLFQPIKH